MSLCLVARQGNPTPHRASDVLPLLLLPWELCMCFVPAVRDVVAFGCLVGRRFSMQSQGHLALAAPTLGAPCVLRAHCVQCPWIWLLSGATLLCADRAGASNVFPLLLLPWEICACVMPAVRNALVFGHLAWVMLLHADHVGGQQGLAVAAPTLGAPQKRHVRCA
jgi:hypothetical protein